MKAVLIAISFALASSSALACTAEEFQKKATDFSTKIQELAAKDPQKAADISQKLSDRITTKSATDLEANCKIYDEMLAEANK